MALIRWLWETEPSMRFIKLLVRKVVIKLYEYDYYSYYEGLAQHIGVANLIRILPFDKEQISSSLHSGDEHLNRLPLPKWDVAAGCSYKTWKNLIFTSDDPTKVSWKPPWDKTKGMGLSIANRVCVLKHVAKYYVGDANPPVKEGGDK